MTLAFPPSVRSTEPSRPTPSRWPGGKRSSIRRSPRPPGPPAARCTSSTRPGCAATTTPAPPGLRSPRPRRCAPPAPGSPLFLISAISAQGALRFSVLTGTLTAAGFIAFLQRLVHDAEHNGGNPVFCIVDNHPAHGAEAVDRFVASTGGALRLYRLPAYSPALPAVPIRIRALQPRTA